MLLEFLIFVIGLIYGYSRKGREDLFGILVSAIKLAVVIGLVFGLAAFFLIPHPIVLFLVGVGWLATLFLILYFTAIFLLGVIVGDVLEKAT